MHFAMQTLNNEAVKKYARFFGLCYAIYQHGQNVLSVQFGTRKLKDNAIIFHYKLQRVFQHRKTTK